ncbi:MAG: phosphate acetyltransferase [Chlorobi bacterium]|nr:phosphate acetyltransferase [Chlorobiota bacterium]
MNKALYIATIEPNSGKSIVSIGLMNELKSRTDKVGYFRPIIDGGEKPDNHIRLMLEFFKIPQSYEESYGLTRAEIVRLLNENKDDKILEKIIRKYKRLEKKFDFIIIEGSDFSGEGSIVEFEMNIKIASNLSIPAIIIGSGKGKTMDEFIGSMKLAYDGFREREVEVVALIANKILPKNLKAVIERLKKAVNDETYVTAIPRDEFLANPGIYDIIRHFDAKVLFGENNLGRHIKHVAVGAMQMRHFLKYLKSHTLVITPGDRSDIILSALQADKSYHYPDVSGIVLSGGLIPAKSILKLIEGTNNNVPILSVKPQTYEVATQIKSMPVQIHPKDTKKIMHSIRLFKRHVDVNVILEKVFHFESRRVTPSMFLYNLEEMASKEKKRIVLPEATEPRILKAACKITSRDLADVILLGNEKEVKNVAKTHGINLDWDKVQIIDPKESPLLDKYAKKIHELRKHKGVNEAMAYDLAQDPSYFGTMMVREGDADGMVSGAVHTTAHTIKPALQLIKTKPGANFVTSTFFMALPERVSAFADCAIVPNPDAEQLSEIAIATADAAKKFGIEPRVAMLSYSSGESGKGEEVEKVRKATELVRQKRPDIPVEGPIQYDAAVDPEVGQKKMPGSPVAGQATVMIFPDLNTGNNTYKAVQRETGALAIGPMLLGLKKPVNDLSRGATVDDIYNTILLTAIQAQENDSSGDHKENTPGEKAA